METPFVVFVGQQPLNEEVVEIQHVFKQSGNIEEYIKENCKHCEEPSECIPHIIFSMGFAIGKYMFIEQEKMALDFPVLFACLEDANELIQELLPDESIKVLILVNIVTKKGYLYRGPDPTRIQELYIPNFLVLYNFRYTGLSLEILHLGDLRDLENLPKITTCAN
ncbi:TPA: hypothetical protein DIC40_02580 [Patescibacteria group bacterium]|nr:hypothetical protein P148_SR1C00001G0206 [candidate division SR1 bacterium RAAC1_SR1_1]HCY20736.1 hypothetical protein [Candidatus Gracilibacteria bacterium]